MHSIMKGYIRLIEAGNAAEVNNEEVIGGMTSQAGVTLVIPALEKLRHKDWLELKANLGYIARLCQTTKTKTKVSTGLPQ